MFRLQMHLVLVFEKPKTELKTKNRKPKNRMVLVLVFQKPKFSVWFRFYPKTEPNRTEHTPSLNGFAENTIAYYHLPNGEKQVDPKHSMGFLSVYSLCKDFMI